MNNIALELLQEQQEALTEQLKVQKIELSKLTDWIVRGQNKLTGIEQEIASLIEGRELSAINEMMARVIRAEEGIIEPEPKVNMGSTNEKPAPKPSDNDYDDDDEDSYPPKKKPNYKR